MSNAAKSIFVYGIYLIILSFMLLVIPNVALTIFGLPPTNEVWVRVVGMETLFFAFIYIRASQKELTDFFGWTVLTRSLVIVFFALFVAIGFAKPNFILLAITDPFFAAWTWFALRSAKVSGTVQPVKQS
ncbi:MAG: hypothetical protein ABI947_04065 [Chloroflexota bacterium]